MNILIVAYYYPPLNASGSHRPYWWARHLAEQGHTISVLTSRKYAFDGSSDLNFPGHPMIEVIEVDYAALRGRIASKLSRSRFWPWFKATYRKMARISRRIEDGADPRTGWRAAAVDHLRVAAGGYDVVISTFNPKESHLIADQFKHENPKVTWIADYRDHWSLPQSDQDRTEAQMEADRKLERRTVGERADLVVSVSPQFTEVISRFLGRPGLCVSNGHDVSPQEVRRNFAVQATTAATTGRRRIVHTGMIYPNIRDPSPLYAALERLHGETPGAARSFEAVFIGRGTDALKRIPVSPEVSRNVTLLGAVTRSKALELQRGADLLLLLSGAHELDRGTLPGKVFEYVTSGVPVLAIGCDHRSEIHRVLTQTGTGIAVGQDVERIIEVLRVVARGERPYFFEPDLEAINDYHREAQSAILSSWISREIHDRMPL